MDNSFGLALSVKSPRATLSVVSREPWIAPALSARERMVVLLMGHGLSNKGIARRLNIAPETVKSHAKRIFWKLTVQTRAQAVYRAWTLGLIELQ